MAMGKKSILVLGRSVRLMEGMADLLQLVGYPVSVSYNWTDTEYGVRNGNPPGLVIVDLSNTVADAYALARQIRSEPDWSSVPVLYVSFSGDDGIRELQQQSRKNGDKDVHFYAHTLLSMDELLAKVSACLA